MGAEFRAGSSAGTADERRIDRVRIMVFHDNTGILDAQVFDDQVSGPAPLNIDMNIISGSKRFCVIANEPTALTPTLDAVTRFSELDALILDEYNAYNNFPMAPLPMVVVKQEYIHYNRPLSQPVELPVRRAVGKIQMSIAKDASYTNTAFLQYATVINTPTQSQLLEGNPISSPTLTSLDTETFTLPNLILGPCVMKPRYMYEHRWGVGTIEQAIAGNATQIQIQLLVNESSVLVPKTYVIPLIGDYQNGQPVYAVTRNTITNLDVKIFPDGIRVNYTVMDWDEEEIEKEPGDEQGIGSAEMWIPESEYEHELK